MTRQPFPLARGLWFLLNRVRVLACVASSAGMGHAQQAAAESTLVFTHVTLIDPVRQAPLRDATIVVRGERIVAVGTRREILIPRGARVIDAAGKYAIPGLWDMHTHIAQPLLPGAGLANNAGYFLPLFIAHGVTGIRDMGGDLSTLRGWRGEIDQGKRVGPRLIITGEKLGKGPVVPGAPFPVRNVRDIRASMKALRDSGAAFVKLDAVRADLLSDVTREAWELGMRVAGHVELQYSVSDVARAGLRSVEHLDGMLIAASGSEDSIRRVLQLNAKPTLWHRFLVRIGRRQAVQYPEAAPLASYSAQKADSLFDLLRRTGTWQCPTLRLLGALHHVADANLRSPPDSLLVRPAPPSSNGYLMPPFAATNPLVRVYPKMQEMLRAMSARGVGLLAGTDTPGLFAVPGRALHEELGLLVAAGLTPLGALRAATTGPADFLEARDSLGTVRVGAFADMVVLDADPLSDIGNTQKISAVLARGRYFDRRALDGLIAEAARSARQLRAGAR